MAGTPSSASAIAREARKRAICTSSGSSESTSLSALYQGMFSSYGVCVPPPAARYETRPPWFVVRLTSSCRSAP